MPDGSQVHMLKLSNTTKYPHEAGLQVFEEGCPDMCPRLGLRMAVTSHRGIHLQPDAATGRLVCRSERCRAPWSLFGPCSPDTDLCIT